MSQQIYNFIKFLEKKEGRKIPPSAIVRYGTDEEKNDRKIQLAAIDDDDEIIKHINNPNILVSEVLWHKLIEKYGEIPKEFKKYFDFKYNNW
jgi:hypothetical protein